VAGRQVEPDPHRPGRPREHASDAERQRAYRQRQHELAAIEVADLIAESPDRAVRLALAALPPSSLALLRDALLPARRRIS
jgi:hypothetical protein